MGFAIGGGSVANLGEMSEMSDTDPQGNDGFRSECTEHEGGGNEADSSSYYMPLGQTVASHADDSEDESGSEWEDAQDQQSGSEPHDQGVSAEDAANVLRDDIDTRAPFIPDLPPRPTDDLDVNIMDRNGNVPNEIQLSDQAVETIKKAMEGFRLPAPAWASSIPEHEWIAQIAERTAPADKTATVPSRVNR
eukprot:Opistho-2@57518